jgi:hypothetical protein
MDISHLFRPPLVWLVLAEAVLIGILGLVVWHVWQDRFAPGGSAIAVQPALPPATRPPSQGASLASPAPPPGPASAVPRPGPTPGIRTDATFLARELVELNRVETAFQELEWRATRAITDAIQRYLVGVVLPSIERIERGER